MHTILIVEDDYKIASMLKEHIEKYEYKVHIASQFTDIKKEFVEFCPHLVLLDINLPRFDGFYWCRQIRTISNCPIIFISARSDEMNQIMAIENGADDYITKPFNFDLVMAKIKSLLRRTYGSYANPLQPHIYEVSGLYLLYDQHMVQWNQYTIELTKKEFTLLERLLKKAGKIVSREELLESLWDDVDFVDDNTLSVNITRVRKKLQQLGIKNAIETVRGTGYKIVDTWSELS
ncbi:response regulator transcription factor [Thermaerobacillus caldiproteolyticus]|uniref:response regulator transcription factor n=1 Tax=Thermaerobacillus caldiproteolyticus TaxID=247480 RepID=UPI00188AB5B3|nr:response regulator transcription factor [Anoxybacillus caldiproteolyticus]QPA31404.1 response regulator transcription factor [Anoxybacillus caldiproteolyticus]